MTVDNIDTLEEPPPLRRQLLLLLSFWILPFWCFSNAVAGVLALPHSFWRLEFTLLLCLAGFFCLLSWMLSTIRESSISDYSFTGYYWITWMISVVFAPGLDIFYYAAMDWQIAVLPNDTILPIIIYGGVYYLLPACSWFILGQMSWEYYAAYDSSVDWGSIIVDNTPFVAALLIWDASLSDKQWLFTSLAGYLYYLSPKTHFNKLIMQFLKKCLAKNALSMNHQ